jgi:hypothetical protein
MDTGDSSLGLHHHYHHPHLSTSSPCLQVTPVECQPVKSTSFLFFFPTFKGTLQELGLKIAAQL